MNKKQSITNYIYSKLQEAKKTSTDPKPAKTPKPKTPKAKKPSTDPKPAAPHPYDSPEQVQRRQERRLISARLAHKSLRAEFATLSQEEQERREPEFEEKFKFWRDSVIDTRKLFKEQQQYIADFVENLLTEQRKKKPGGYTNAAGEKWTKRHIGRAVIAGPPLVKGERGSLEHIFDAHYDPSTGRVTNKHTGEELPAHITDFFDERNSHESHHVQPAEHEFPEPNWKDDEED